MARAHLWQFSRAALLLIVVRACGASQSATPSRRAFARALAASAIVSPVRWPAQAAVETTGAAEKLAPLLAFSEAIADAAAGADAAKLSQCAAALDRLPSSERDFKAVFDAFSERKSYLTEYKDKNAFIVALTAGFDGPGRPRMGTRAEVDPQAELQAEQFGLRNDVWNALDDGRATLRYLLASASPSLPEDDLRELREALHSAEQSFRAYLALAPPAVLDEARQRL